VFVAGIASTEPAVVGEEVQIAENLVRIDLEILAVGGRIAQVIQVAGPLDIIVEEIDGLEGIVVGPDLGCDLEAEPVPTHSRKRQFDQLKVSVVVHVPHSYLAVVTAD
jgi:hypothetical protein